MTGQVAATVLGVSACVVMGGLITRAVRKSQGARLTRPEVWVIAKWQVFRLHRDMRRIERRESENS